MTYPSLLVIHGQLLHTIQRSNNRQTTFTADAIGHCSSETLVVGGGLYLCYLLYWWSFCLVSQAGVRSFIITFDVYVILATPVRELGAIKIVRLH